MTSEVAALAVRDTLASFCEHPRLPILLLLLLTAICMATLWAPPAGRTGWFLEVSPGLLMVLWLVFLSVSQFSCSPHSEFARKKRAQTWR
jgi:hypothetical protein